MPVAPLFGVVVIGLLAVSPVTTQHGITRKELAEYRLTAGTFEKFLRASQRIAAIVNHSTAFRAAPLFPQEIAQGGDVTIVAMELEARLRHDPGLSSALAAASMSAREYTKFVLTLVAARLADGFLEAGLLKTVPSGAAAENVAFVRAHRVATDAVLVDLGVELK